MVKNASDQQCLDKGAQRHVQPKHAAVTSKRPKEQCGYEVDLQLLFNKLPDTLSGRIAVLGG